MDFVDELDSQIQGLARQAPQRKGVWSVPFDALDERMLAAHVEVMSLPMRPVIRRWDDEGNPIWGGPIVYRFNAPLVSQYGDKFQVGDRVVVDGDKEGLIVRRREDVARNGLVHVLYEVQIEDKKIVICPENISVVDVDELAGYE